MYRRLSHEAGQKLPFQTYFKKIGFPKVCADWCEENTVGEWGWHFSEDCDKTDRLNDVYIGFEYQDDMFMFQIYWAERFDGRENDNMD